MKTLRQGLSALAALGLISLCPAHAQEFITNGGFETGDFTGWTLANDDFSVVSDVFANSGTYSAFLGASKSDGTLSQTITTVPGQAYTFTFYFAGNGDSPSDFSAAFGGTTVFSVNDPANDASFLPYTYTVVANGTATPVVFTERDDDNFMHLDDVSVTPAPEPSQYAALGLGVLGLSGLALKARKRRDA